MKNRFQTTWWKEIGQASRAKNLKTFVALGLSTILPSLAFSAESDEALNQLLITAPQAPSDSKIKNVENYSQTVDLRTSRAITNDGSIFNSNPVVINQDTIIGTTSNRWNVSKDDKYTLVSKNITINNNATLTINATNLWGFGYVFASDDQGELRWSGGNIVVNFVANGWGGNNGTRGGILSRGLGITIDSDIDYTYTEYETDGGNYRGVDVSAATAGDSGKVKFHGNSIKITSIGANTLNKGIGKVAIASCDSGTLFLNARDDGSINNLNATVQITGSISTGRFSALGVGGVGGGKVYAHFSGSSSFLQGNIYAGRFGKGSVVASFSNGATMNGDIALLADGSTSSNITFSSDSSLTGNINALSDGNHNITFDSSNFIGVIKRDTSTNSIQGTSISSMETSLGSLGNGANTTITFKNTAGKIFGNGTDDVVASSYNGSVVGTFDVSANSTTAINGGNDGSLGFKGSGKNTLVFDFKGNARTRSNKAFTIAGGNTNSTYTISSFTQKGQDAFDYTSLTSSDTLYSKLENTGIKIAVDTSGQTTNNHLNGALFFQKTNITVGSGNKALFANSGNIAGTNNSLNGLALGAMFGNATWNDANQDGYITTDEIISNRGVSYKLTNSSGTNDKSSNGNIGKDNDGVKKHIAFIFADGTEENGYVFNEKTQGYSGSIAGGTSDSQYYFVNSGYVNANQIENAQGKITFINTAVRGDLGVQNKSVNALLDFSDGKNGVIGSNGSGSSNIVGAGSKDITFNFTGNDRQVKYAGAVVGDATKDDMDPTNGTADNQTAKYTMLNLVKYKYESGNSGSTVIDGNGGLKVSAGRAGSKTLINAIQEAGLTGFNDPSANNLSGKQYGQNGDKTDTSVFSTTNTTLALRGTSLDTANISFKDYIYDFAFGSGWAIGDVEGVALRDSKLKGIIDLTASNANSNTANANSGHSFVFKGTAIEGTEAGVLATAGKLGGFSYDDSNADYTQSVTFKLSGLDQTNHVSNSTSGKVKGDSLIFTKTNLEGNLWADNSVGVNLDFRDGRTWKMDESGVYIKNASDNFRVTGKVKNLNGSTTPTLKIRHDAGTYFGRMEFNNTGMTVKLWQQGGWGNGSYMGNSFNFRGTSLETFWSNGGNQGNADGIHGYTDEGIKLVFASGDNVATTKTSASKTTVNITDEASGEGNYIASSYGRFTKVVTKKSFDITFIGKDSVDYSQWGAKGGYFGEDSKLTFINASNSLSSTNGYADGGGIGRFLSHQNDDGNSNARADIIIEGTSIDWGSHIVARGNNQDKLFFKITFVNDDNTSDTYIDSTKYADLATTNANGALKDNILRVQESKLVNGLDFKDSNANILFVGDGAQSLDGATGEDNQSGNDKILKGGSASSIFTFRDSNLNAGNGTSSIQNIKGTIAFDLSHANEDMSISGTLKNMLASGGKHQVQFKDTNNNAVLIDRLVFVNVNDIATSTSLRTLGQYFNDKDTFGNLSLEDYSDLAKLATVDKNKSSSLTFADNGVVALTSGEVVFVGENSHKFDSSEATANKLGNSTGGTLTFVDAGTLKIANLLNEVTDAQSQTTQTGKGTINLIGGTRVELASNNTLSLKTTNSTGEGITINAVFTDSNILGTGVGVKSTSGVTDVTSLGSVASNVNIGQTGETTEYHILFDYTEALKDKANKGFGQYQVYQGNITGLTSDSVIKFKNAGYINGSQIEHTQATILVDNTQIKGDFRGDSAILDFRNDRPAISEGAILTSDTRTQPASTQNVLSQKTLTFDLTGSIQKPIFSGVIQAGYKVAPDYTDNAQSVLTFQNASAMTLGDDNTSATRGARTINSSVFIQSLAKDVGFSGIADAKTEETGFTSSDKTSYILKGTKLVFQGTSISGTDIVENNYELDLNFDMSANRGQTALGETLNRSKLTANSITMGEYDDTRPLGLKLSFKDKGSLVAPNGLNVKLKDGARFNLTAESSNGNIGTIILSENTATRVVTQPNPFNLSAQSSMSIAEGAMSFVGVFDTSKDTTTGTDSYGAVNVSFNGDNKAYGIIAHKGNAAITLKEDALLSDTDAQTLGYTKTDAQFADLVIDATATASGKTLTLNLAHTSGLVGIVGVSGGSYTDLNLSSVSGNIALKNNFNLTEGATFGGSSSAKLKIEGNTLNLKLAEGKSLNIAENGLKDINEQGSKPTITLKVVGGNKASHLTFTNLGNQISQISISNPDDGWGVGGNWNIRGTNITLNSISAENDRSNNKTYNKNFVFAKGSGTQTNTSNGALLSELTTSDKIAESSLTINGRSIFDSGSLVLIGKESLAGDPSSHKFDGVVKGNAKTTIGLYNTILRSGDVLLDNTNDASNWVNNAQENVAHIDDVVEIRGTDVFNLTAKKIQKNGQSSDYNLNNSTINAVFVNGTTQADGDTSITGARYIDASGDHAYASAYTTNNAGGALTQTKLKTLESKAYGNITMEETVTATMKFIGENSHSFDGKTKVDDSGNVYYNKENSDWYKYEIGDGTNNTKGAVYLAISTTNTTNTTNFALATLAGGNANSRFDFDHTSVNLEQIKNAAGKTYVYNSTVLGDIAVKNGVPATIPNTSSTTIFFNEQMTDATALPSASANFIQEYANDGISLDLGVAHQLTADNLGATDTNGTPTTNKVLENTDKQTNLIFIGKGSIDAKVNEGNKNNNSGNSIDLSFIPTGTLATGYSFTFVNAGEFTDAQINTTGKNFGDVTGSSSDGSTTIFGSNAVILIDTYVLGERAFSQKGFVDMAQTRNQKSSWTGDDSNPDDPIIQNLIFDFNQGVYGDNQKIQFNGNKADAIANTSAESSYIFTNIFKSGTKDQDRVLTLTQNGLRTAINNQLKTLLTSNVDAISNNVKGTLGLRGVSIRGNINESTSAGDKVDIVFNSTSNISYIDSFDEKGKHSATIQETGYNKVANIYGINNKKSDISGYAVLISSDTTTKAVSISGNAKKTIAFIGDKAVNGEVGGFENLSISGGSADSKYTFHTVGTLRDGFLTGVKLQGNSRAAPEANLGTFEFINSTIIGNINANTNTSDNQNTNNEARLVFDNVAYSGTISGTLIKNLKFAKGTDNVSISGGSDESSYDFSNLAGSSINLNINMSNGSNYYASKVVGFENGDISLTGSIKLATTVNEVTTLSYSNSFAFNDTSSWRVTDDSRVMNLSLSNTGANYNLDLSSAPRTNTKPDSRDLRVLEVGNLTSNGGQVLLGTEIDTQDQSKSKSDKINASVINQGTLYVTAKDVNIANGSFATDGDNAIVLVTANTSYGEVKGAQRKQGLSYVITELEHQTSVDGRNWSKVEDESAVSSSDSHRWVLSSFDAKANQELVDESGFIASNSYRMLMIETNNLNKRMGDLRDDDYNQGAWIRVFNGSDSGEGAKNLYTNIQLGYDYGTPAIGAKNYTGVAFSTSIVDIDGTQYNGKANTYSLGVYNAYIADSGLYVDTIAKYLYMDQKLTPIGGSQSHFNDHSLSLGVEVGYRAYMGESNFYIEPQAEVIGGVIFGAKDINMGVIGGMNVTGELKTTTAINTRVGLVQGYSLKTESGFRADFRLGVSMVNEFVSDSNPVRLYDGITEASTSIGNDTKAVVNVGTNLILTDQWRVYIDAERSFGGSRNVDYQANVGARFSFGDKLTSLPKPEKPLPLKLKSEEKKEQESTQSNDQKEVEQSNQTQEQVVKQEAPSNTQEAKQ